jgi:ABC-2 family transporter protein
VRWGPGPVFFYECLASSRRRQTYVVRSIGVAILLAAVALIALPQSAMDSSLAWRAYAALGEAYFYAIVGVVLTLVMLVAPAATAGAICVDRTRGTLSHMLVTDLSDAEIVLGKLAARLLPILFLIACTWPVLSICSLLGGIDPTALTLAFAIILAVAALGCSMALALSVWARKPHEVVMMTYTLWILVLLLWPAWFALARAGWVAPPDRFSLVANPYYLAFAPYQAPGLLGFSDYCGFFAAALGASIVFILLAVWRMRPVACRTLAHEPKPAFGLVARFRRWLPGPSLDRNPVLWREWHRSRPSRWMMGLTLLIGGTTGIACVFGAITIWEIGVQPSFESPGQFAGIVGYVVQLSFGLLMLSAVSPLSMSEERARGSLDLLAATALSTPAIVIGKWLSTFRLVPFLAIGPGLVGLALATAYKSPSQATRAPGMLPDFYEQMSRGELLLGVALLVATILVHGALIASIGLAFATWIKQQGRAIAATVTVAVMISAGWPILAGIGRVGIHEWGVTHLSPVVAAGTLSELLSVRLASRLDLLWWTAFWDIECMVAALGLLWLSVRTFDVCFGRMPERPRQTPVLSDFIVVLAAVIGVGSLFGAITFWSKGLWLHDSVEDFAVLASSLLLTVGFLLVSAHAPLSISRRAASPAQVLAPAAVVLDRRLFAITWWQTFRLVLLLAIGPAFIALALATARSPVEVMTKAKTLPGGITETIRTNSSGKTYVAVTDAAGVSTFRYPTDEELAAAAPKRVRRPLSWFLTPLVAVLTIPVQGAAFVSLGLALCVWIRRRTLAIVASVCLVLFVTIGWPFLVLLYDRAFYLWGLIMASPPAAVSIPLIHLRHREDLIADTLLWAAIWNALFILLAIVVSALAIWTLDRRVADARLPNRLNDIS